MDYYDKVYLNDIKKYVPIKFIKRLEKKYYDLVAKQGLFKNFCQNQQFLKNPEAHPAIFTDHGIIHVCDVANKLLKMLPQINGILIESRTNKQLHSMKTLGVVIALIHDIGMSHNTPCGRKMHPDFVTHEIFSDDFDEFIEILWRSDLINPIKKRLNYLASKELLTCSPKIIFREILSLANCHSKSQVSMRILQNPLHLRELMQHTLQCSLYELFFEKTGEKPNEFFANNKPNLEKYYDNFTAQSFAWLNSPDFDLQKLTLEIVDVLRCIRTADAIRQRGIALRTSGGYQIFMDRTTGNSVYAFKKNEYQTYLMSSHDIFGAGQANIAKINFTLDGDLHIAFYRGHFHNILATKKAIYATAAIVVDIMKDVIFNFTNKNKKKLIQCLIEETMDNPYFSNRVIKAIKKINTKIYQRAKLIPCLKYVSDVELEHYLNGRLFDWNKKERLQLLRKLKQAGMKLPPVDTTLVFHGVKIIHLSKGEILMQSKGLATFVYIPLDTGLKGKPVGGYENFYPEAYFTIGNIGVITGGVRNATIIANKAIELLMIPEKTYLSYWHATFNINDFIQLAAKFRK